MLITIHPEVSISGSLVKTVIKNEANHLFIDFGIMQSIEAGKIIEIS